MTDKIEAILSKRHTVQIDDVELELQRPSRAAVVDLRQRLVADADSWSEDDVEKAVEYTSGIVRVCVPGLASDDEAYDLVLAAGGEESELVTTCFRLCGLKRGPKENGVADDPIPSG